MIDPAWFFAAVAAGAVALGWSFKRLLRGLHDIVLGHPRGDAAGPVPLFNLAVLGASLYGGGLGGWVAAACFGVYPAEMLLGAAFCGAVPTALATASLLW
ncbi:MAG: hypothetical protein ACYDCL_10600 [Myxococcales bacterium]